MSAAVLASLLGTGITALGGIYSANAAAKSAQAVNSANIANSRWLNNESVELANTAHQREIVDLRAAGLNPVLSVSGNGSPVPSLQSPNLTNPGESVASAISSASRAAGQQVANLALTKAETDALNLEVVQNAERTSAVKARAAADKEIANADRLDAMLHKMQTADQLQTYDRLRMENAPPLRVGGWNPDLEKLYRDAYISDLKNRGNANWRENVRVIGGAVNDAASAAGSFGKFGKSVKAIQMMKGGRK